MRYSSMRNLDISNGEGVGVSLFVQGCPFHCKTVLILIHGILMVEKSGQKKQKINL